MPSSYFTAPHRLHVLLHIALDAVPHRSLGHDVVGRGQEGGKEILDKHDWEGGEECMQVGSGFNSAVQGGGG